MPPGMPSQDMMAYWGKLASHPGFKRRGTTSYKFPGYKFETLSVLPTTWDAASREQIEGRIHEVVNNKAQYCSVVRTGFGKVKLVIGGEVDASKLFHLLSPIQMYTC